MDKKTEVQSTSSSSELIQQQPTTIMIQDVGANPNNNNHSNQQMFSSDNSNAPSSNISSAPSSSEEHIVRRDKENSEFNENENENGGSVSSPDVNPNITEPFNDDYIKNDDTKIDLLRATTVVADFDLKLLPSSNSNPLITSSVNSNAAQSDDSNGATASTSLNSVDCKRHQVEKALGFLELVRKKYTKEPGVYNSFLNLMRSFKTHRLSEESVSLKEIVDKVKNIFSDNTELFEHFSEFVIGDKRNENMGGLIDAANNVQSISGHNNDHISIEKFPGDTIDVNVDNALMNQKYEQISNVNNSMSSRVEISPNEIIKQDNTSMRSINDRNQHPNSNSLPVNNRISIPNTMNNHSPRVVSSIQHRPPPIYSHPSGVDGVPSTMNNNNINNGGGVIRPMYGPQMIPPHMPPGYRSFNNYPNAPPSGPPSMNQYNSRRSNVQHPGMVHNPVPMVGVPREAYCGYRNTTPTPLPPNVNTGRRGQRPPANFTALQSALYHNITTTGGVGTSSSINEITAKPPSKRPYNYVITGGNSTSKANESTVMSSSPTLQSASQSSNNLNNVYYSKINTSQNIGITPMMVGNNNQQYTQENNDRFPPHTTHTTHATHGGHTYGGGGGGGGTELFDSFDRGAFDFVSTVKMYFTDVVKKPRLYHEFVHNLRDYQMQHELIEMSSSMPTDERKLKENELLKKLMDGISELFNQNIELINSFLHYLPTLNSNICSVNLTPFHATFMNKQQLSQLGTSSGDLKINNAPRVRQQNSQSSHISATPTQNNKSDIKAYQTSAGNSCNNSNLKGVSFPVGGTSNSNAINMNNPATSNTTINNNKFPMSNNANNQSAPNTSRGGQTFMPFSNKHSTKPPAMSTSRQIPPPRGKIPYANNNNNNSSSRSGVSFQFDPNFVMQIFTEIKAVTNVKDYSNILKCINLYNINVTTFTELLYLIKSITHNNKIAYSKMRTILKNMADMSLEFDSIFPEIFYPGSEMSTKVGRPSYRTTPTVSSIVAGGVDGQLITTNHPSVTSTHTPRVVISRHNNTPNPNLLTSSNNITTAINVIGASNTGNQNYFSVSSTGSNLKYNTSYNNQPPRAQRIAGDGSQMTVGTPNPNMQLVQNSVSNINERPNIIDIQSYNMKTSPKLNAFVDSLSETQHARFYLDRNQRISSSYFMIGSSAPIWTSSGMTAVADSVLNSECLSEAHTALEERTTNTTPATFARNIYEEELTRVEEERFELDVLLDLMTNVQAHLLSVLTTEKDPTRDDIFGKGMKYFIYKCLQNLYGESYYSVVKALKLDPIFSLRVLLPRIETKIKEWNVSKLHLEEHWRKVSIKNYLKALDYHFISFKSTDLKKIKAKQLIKEMEQLSIGPISGETKIYTPNTIYYHAPIAYDGDANTKAYLTISYYNQLMVANATHLIMYHAKRQSGLTSDDKGYIDFLMNKNFLPKFFNATNEQIDKDEIEIENGFHFFASDDLYVFFRLHNLLCDRLHKIYDICKDVLAVSELYNPNIVSTHSNRSLPTQNLNGPSYNQAAYRYPFLLSKSIQHRFSANRRPTSLEELYDFFIELVQELLDGTVDTDFFEDECRYMFGTESYIIFTIDRLVQECVKYLNFMVFNSPSQNLIDLFIKCSPISASQNNDLFGEYKLQMDPIMKPLNYYFDMIFSAKKDPNGVENNNVVSAKIFLYQSFGNETNSVAKTDPLQAMLPESVFVETQTQNNLIDVQGNYNRHNISENELSFSTNQVSLPHSSLQKNFQIVQQACETSYNLVSNCDFDGGANYTKSILTDVNFDDWRNYVSYFTSNDTQSPTVNDINESTAIDDLKPLNDELNFARDKSLFMVRNLRPSFKRLPKKASQIIGLIKHLYNNDPSSDAVIFDSSVLMANFNNNNNLSTNTSPPPLNSFAISSDNTSSSVIDVVNNQLPISTNKLATNTSSSHSRNHLQPSKIDQYSNGLIIIDNETYALEPVAFKMQFLRDSYYFLYNKCSAADSLQYYYDSASSLPRGEYLESIVCRNTQYPTENNNHELNFNINAQSSNQKSNDDPYFSADSYKL